MIEPGLSLQAAVGAALAGDSAILVHVAPENIRAGSIRPENMPSVVIAPARVALLGRASGGQMMAEVRGMVHVWAVEDGTETAQALAGAVLMRLMDAPRSADFWIDDWDRPELAWLPLADQAMPCAHAAIGLRAVLRWRSI